MQPLVVATIGVLVRTIEVVVLAVGQTELPTSAGVVKERPLIDAIEIVLAHPEIARVRLPPP